jgi:hypothetical protein
MRVCNGVVNVWHINMPSRREELRWLPISPLVRLWVGLGTPARGRILAASLAGRQRQETVTFSVVLPNDPFHLSVAGGMGKRIDQG